MHLPSGRKQPQNLICLSKHFHHQVCLIDIIAHDTKNLFKGLPANLQICSLQTKYLLMWYTALHPSAHLVGDTIVSPPKKTVCYHMQ